MFPVATPKNSPFWEKIHKALDDKVEEIHTVCDLLFPTTPKQVKGMLDYVQYHNAWVPTQVSTPDSTAIHWNVGFDGFYSWPTHCWSYSAKETSEKCKVDRE